MHHRSFDEQGSAHVAEGSSCYAQVTASKAAVASLLSVLSQHAAKQSSLQPRSIPSAPEQNNAQQPSSSRQGSSSSSSSSSIAGSQMPGDPAPNVSVQEGSANRDAALAAATALNNLLLDKDAQRLVCDLHGIATVSKLLLQTDWILAARAAGKSHQPVDRVPAACTVCCWYSYVLLIAVEHDALL